MERSKPKFTGKISPEVEIIKEFPLVSIITPTYNHEKFIGTCIESVVNQTYENWEMIVIDDGSTDKTGSIVASFDDKRIIYIKQENLGVWKLNKTYNKALNLSKGDLIAILEGDDAWPSYKLEEQVKIFNNHKIVLSWGRKNTINEKNEIISFDSQSLKKFINMPQKEVTKNLIISNFIQACTAVIDRNALLSIGGFLQYENTPYVDYPTFLELSLKGKFYPSDRILGYWRKHKAQVTTEQQTEMNKSLMSSIEFYDKLNHKLKKSLKFELNDKIRYNEKMLNDQTAVSARLALIEGNKEDAKNYFKNIFKNGNLKIKIQSLLGIICSLLDKDLEWFAIITCKPKLKASGDWETTIFNKNGDYTFFFKIQILILKFIGVFKPLNYINTKYLIENDLSI